MIIFKKLEITTEKKSLSLLERCSINSITRRFKCRQYLLRFFENLCPYHKRELLSKAFCLHKLRLNSRSWVFIAMFHFSFIAVIFLETLIWSYPQLYHVSPPIDCCGWGLGEYVTGAVIQ